VNEVHAPDVARTRLMGLAKNLTLFGLAAIAHTIQKGAKFLCLYGMPEPACAKLVRPKSENTT
jgi:hypothetical protein